MARERRRTAEIAWLERTNPLQGLSIRDAQAIFDAARQGDTQRLHWLFQEVEAVNPVLLTCVERRASAISGFQWNVSARPSAKDDALADEQRRAAADFLAGIENLTEAIEHLDLAFFRGFSHVQPVWLDDGTVREIYLPESWTFLRRNGVWYHNPLCTGFNDDAQDCTDARLVTIVRRRPIDYPALSIHVRAAVGKRDWGRFIERYALPKPAVFMHPGATGEQKSDYLEGAQAVENGQVSVWPNGASLTDFAGGSRGTDPFSSFIEYQDRQVVLLATGGTLTSLAQADTGSLAGGAQMDVWKEIVARDASVVAAAINRGLVRPFLEAKFPGRPVEADFVFDTAKRPTAKEVAEVASTLKNAGYVIVQDELEEAVGFTLEKAPEQSPAPGGLPFMNKASITPETRNSGPEPTPTPADDHGVLAAFAKDTGPAAAAIARLLQNPSPEAAAGLLKELPDLIPDDPALAAVIADAMAAEFATSKSQPSQKSQQSQDAPLANKTDANGMEHAESGDGGGQFVKKDGGASCDQSEQTDNEHNPATTEQVSEFQNNLPDKITPEEFDSLLTTGFIDKDGAGNNVKYGTLLRDHWGTDNHGVNDIKARKARLGIAVRMVRESKPMPSGNPNKPNEKVYFGLVDGKAYIAVADEHNEIDAIEMVSYRRDSRRDER